MNIDDTLVTNLHKTWRALNDAAFSGLPDGRPLDLIMLAKMHLEAALKDANAWPVRDADDDPGAT